MNDLQKLDAGSAPRVLYKGVSETPSNINEYIIWFEKIDVNTIIWQAIVILVIFYFGNQLKALLGAFILKLPQMKSIAGAKFELALSDGTQKEIEENSNKLTDEIESYEVVTQKDPNIVFWTIYIDTEGSLLELYSRNFPEEKGLFLQTRTHKLIRKLVEKEVLKPNVKNIFDDLLKLRNQIANGQKPLKNLDEAQPYLKAMLLFKDNIFDALLKTQEIK